MPAGPFGKGTGAQFCVWRYFNGIYLAASAHTCCNSVFFLQLYLVNKDKVSENSESYT